MARCSRVAVIIRDKVLGKRRVTKLGLDTPSRLSCKQPWPAHEEASVRKATVTFVHSHTFFLVIEEDPKGNYYGDPPLIEPPKSPTTGCYDWCSALL